MMWKKWKYWRFVFLIASILYYFCLPTTLFKDPYSTVLVDNDGGLLSATVSKDGQWRFPVIDIIPQKFVDAITTFEDKRFFYHPGVDIISLLRASKQNLEAGKVVSGGSTLTMQVIRMMRKGKPRTFTEKITEIILATRLEWRYSKQEILRSYASHAPFGGNVVGLEAACWRYFQRAPENLSWGEAAMLAVLPNAPSLIHPGKNRAALISKRNALLDKLWHAGKIDSLSCVLAKEEHIPDAPGLLPRKARHLLLQAARDGYAQQKVSTSIQATLQDRMEHIIALHHKQLQGNYIFNAAIIVLAVETGHVIAYVGNTDVANAYHGDEVDIIRSPRSTGSILKPLLYAAALDEGKLLPNTLLPDVPTVIAGFSPKNFSEKYDGAVSADEALIRSLNVPAVHLLRKYRYEKFHSLLTRIGMTTLNNNPDHYGLSLILGGAEGSLWDIVGIYAGLARTLNHYFTYPGKRRYSKQDFHPPIYLTQKTPGDQTKNIPEEKNWLSAASIYQTFSVLRKLYRPYTETGWNQFTSARKVAWKTGTSYGFRDAWAIGVTPEYVVGVWVGNADGEGRPGLTGIQAAAPILFDVFEELPETSWFRMPKGEMTPILVCPKSGMRISDACAEKDTMWITSAGLISPVCTYHQLIPLTKDGKFRVHSSCEAVSEIQMNSWFVLPPVQEYYFKNTKLSYKPLPPLRSDCGQNSGISNMELIYPKPNAKIFIPRKLNGTPDGVVFELAHHMTKTHVYWHIDDTFIAATERDHRILVNPTTGYHTLTIVDATGEVINQKFHVVSHE